MTMKLRERTAKRYGEDDDVLILPPKPTAVHQDIPFNPNATPAAFPSLAWGEVYVPPHERSLTPDPEYPVIEPFSEMLDWTDGIGDGMKLVIMRELTRYMGFLEAGIWMRHSQDDIWEFMQTIMSEAKLADQIDELERTRDDQQIELVARDGSDEELLQAEDLCDEAISKLPTKYFAINRCDIARGKRYLMDLEYADDEINDLNSQNEENETWSGRPGLHLNQDIEELQYLPTKTTVNTILRKLDEYINLEICLDDLDYDAGVYDLIQRAWYADEDVYAALYEALVKRVSSASQEDNDEGTVISSIENEEDVDGPVEVYLTNDGTRNRDSAASRTLSPIPEESEPPSKKRKQPNQYTKLAENTKNTFSPSVQVLLGQPVKRKQPNQYTKRPLDPNHPHKPKERQRTKPKPSRVRKQRIVTFKLPPSRLREFVTAAEVETEEQKNGTDSQPAIQIQPPSTHTAVTVVPPSPSGGVTSTIGGALNTSQAPVESYDRLIGIVQLKRYSKACRGNSSLPPKIDTQVEHIIEARGSHGWLQFQVQAKNLPRERWYDALSFNMENVKGFKEAVERFYQERPNACKFQDLLKVQLEKKQRSVSNTPRNTPRNSPTSSPKPTPRPSTQTTSRPEVSNTPTLTLDHASLAPNMTAVAGTINPSLSRLNPDYGLVHQSGGIQNMSSAYQNNTQVVNTVASNMMRASLIPQHVGNASIHPSPYWSHQSQAQSGNGPAVAGNNMNANALPPNFQHPRNNTGPKSQSFNNHQISEPFQASSTLQVPRFPHTQLPPPNAQASQPPRAHQFPYIKPPFRPTQGSHLPQPHLNPQFYQATKASQAPKSSQLPQITSLSGQPEQLSGDPRTQAVLHAKRASWQELKRVDAIYQHLRYVRKLQDEQRSQNPQYILQSPSFGSKHLSPVPHRKFLGSISQQKQNLPPHDGAIAQPRGMNGFVNSLQNIESGRNANKPLSPKSDMSKITLPSVSYPQRDLQTSTVMALPTAHSSNISEVSNNRPSTPSHPQKNAQISTDMAPPVFNSSNTPKIFEEEPSPMLHPGSSPYVPNGMALPLAHPSSSLQTPEIIPPLAGQKHSNNSPPFVAEPKTNQLETFQAMEAQQINNTGLRAQKQNLDERARNTMPLTGFQAFIGNTLSNNPNARRTATNNMALQISKNPLSEHNGDRLWTDHAERAQSMSSETWDSPQLLQSKKRPLDGSSGDTPNPKRSRPYHPQEAQPVTNPKTLPYPQLQTKKRPYSDLGENGNTPAAKRPHTESKATAEIFPGAGMFQAFNSAASADVRYIAPQSVQGKKMEIIPGPNSKRAMNEQKQNGGES